MTEAANALLLVADALLYFTALAALFHARRRIGIGAFFCALGVMHFLETYLASTFYVALPFGLVASPGSTVLFTGKLLLLLVVYIREDAVVVRQPIYGLLLGNLLLFALAFLLRHHSLQPLAPGRAADLGLLDEMGLLMVWGTAVLFLDCILIILLYERSRAWLGMHVVWRIAACGALVLSFDQVTFFIGLHLLTGAPLAVLLGGWVAKMAFVALYSGLAGLYLTRFERMPVPAEEGARRRIGDIFDLLTYRERYEELIARSRRDALTGVLVRGELELEGRRRVAEAARNGRPLTLMLVDIDHFKGFNDRFGHAQGDAVLRRIAAAISGTVRSGDAVFRYGGEEFVVIADGLAHGPAAALGERIRRAIAGEAEAGPCVTASIGFATCAEDAADYDGLFAIADQRLYRAKSSGRNRVIGETAPDEKAVRLAYAG